MASSNQMTPEKKKRGLNADQTNPGDPRDAEKFGEIVYKKGGQFRDRGRPYSYRGVTSVEEYERLLAEGWSKTLAEAFEVRSQPDPEGVVSGMSDAEIYDLAAEGFTWKEITKKSGNKAPHLAAQRHAKAEGKPYPPVTE